MELHSYIDHTILKADATAAAVEKLCREAMEYSFASVCVNSCNVPQVADLLKGSAVHCCTVVGFPLGAMNSRGKVFEAESAVEAGAQEVDMVINVGFLKDGKFDAVRDEIAAIKKACGENILKVILETCFLTDEEKVKACNLSVEGGADFVKTSTGFGSGGATYHDVELMIKTVGDEVKIKASGGIRDRETALEYIRLGAHRLGTSSGIAIVGGDGGSGGGY